MNIVLFSLIMKLCEFCITVGIYKCLFKGNGYIAVSDLRDILRALDENVSEDELDEMIAEIDADGSGTVDFDGLFVAPLS